MSTKLVVAVTVIALASVAPAAADAETARAAGGLEPLVSAISLRLSTADQVASAKWGTGKPIDDPDREGQVYRAALSAARDEQLDPARVEQIFRTQIDANKAVQRGLFLFWQTVPPAAPVQRPDLAAVRPLLDSLNVEIVSQIGEQRVTLAAADCVPALASAAVRAATAQRLDGLHSVALVHAVSALCGPVSAR
ncbi:chorismate mutase [Rhodococcus sp. ABRD24]|uniref:chorismate mutase n=1 Tax=Rhodococcus sp. ABRD24 TaxID=2507582 RepID=UPI00103BFF2E|nr:chorismate mutase [Rhodococcus sp. ABRD24]QBJ94850.1 chorismate mutase [Rhodococcus sp. ABRD24]